MHFVLCVISFASSSTSVNMNSTEGPLGTFTRSYDDFEPFNIDDLNIKIRSSATTKFYDVRLLKGIPLSAKKRRRKTLSRRSPGHSAFACMLIGFHIIGCVKAESVIHVRNGELVTLPFGKGYNCSDKHFQFHFTPVNKKEVCISAGRDCKKEDIYSVDNLCRLCFTATSETVGHYRLYDDYQQRDLSEITVSLDELPKSGASGLPASLQPIFCLMTLGTVAIMIKHFL